MVAKDNNTHGQTQPAAPAVLFSRLKKKKNNELKKNSVEEERTVNRKGRRTGEAKDFPAI